MWISKKKFCAAIQEAVDAAIASERLKQQERDRRAAIHEKQLDELKALGEQVDLNLKNIREKAEKEFKNLPKYKKTDKCELCGHEFLTPKAKKSSFGMYLAVKCDCCGHIVDRKGLKE